MTEYKFREEVVFTFIWSFKCGDNILYNFSVLQKLYEARKKLNEGQALFNKPITVIIVSIIECIIADFIDRVKDHRNEPVPNLTSTEINDFRYTEKGGTLVWKDFTKLTHFINQIKKHDIFDTKTPRFYQVLDYFRQVRNRIHIQMGHKDKLPPNESEIFTDKNLELVQLLLARVIEKMFVKFPRPQNADKLSVIDVKQFPYPWL